MKKKKLKKKIKQLERKIKEEERREINLSNWTMAKVDELKKLTKELKDANINKKSDNRINILWEWMQRSGIDFHDWGKTPTYAEEVVYTEDIQRQINEINDRLHILDMRTQTDYTQFSKNEEKTCDTCDYHGLSGCGTQCIECPANNKKEA